MAYRPADFYEKNGVTPLLGRTALALDPEKKTVRLDDGRLIPYDKLLVATGSRPFVPPMEGLDGVEKAFTFMSLDDAEALEAALTPETRVLIVGAGLIGLKCAEGMPGAGEKHRCGRFGRAGPAQRPRRGGGGPDPAGHGGARRPVPSGGEREAL